MSYQKRKFYVVWEGRAPGIYDSWEECKMQVENFPGAKYRSYPTQTEATEAFRGDASEQLALMRKLAVRMVPATPVDYSSNPEIRKDAISVDGAWNIGPCMSEAVRKFLE